MGRLRDALQRIFSRRERDGGVSPHPAGEAGPPAASPARPPQLRVIDGEKSRSAWLEDPFDQLLAWKKVEPWPDLVQDDADDAAEQTLASGVLEHFNANKPAPSSLPAAALQVITAVANPNVEVRELTRIISLDPALSAGLLKVANSPAWAGAGEFQTIREAVTRLGMAEVARVAGIVAARTLFQQQVRTEFTQLGGRWNDIFTDAVVAARGAAWQALKVKGANSDVVFLAGMLHDLGRSVALRSLAALAAQGDEFTLDDERVDRVIERVHVEIGGAVHAEWGLPRFPTLVAMRHHDLGLPAEGEYLDLHLVRLASSLVQLRRAPWRQAQAREEVRESAKVLKLDAYALRTLDTQLTEEAQRVGQALGDKPPRPSAPRAP